MATVSLTTTISRASTQTVQFSDGMIVTADDLGLASRHPLELMQVLVRAYFGCGVVCGLGLEPTEAVEDRGPCKTADLKYALTVHPGVALDCVGYPLELCGPVCVDLTPNPCVAPGAIKEGETRALHIALRRAADTRSGGKGGCGCGGSASSGGCGCGGGTGGCGCSSGETQCSRVRDAVEIGVFIDLPDGICIKEEPAGHADGNADTRADAQPDLRRLARDPCDCLKACPSCDRCGEWVYLGEVSIDKSGIKRDSVKLDRRAYVKPIDCLCGTKRVVDTPDDGDGSTGADVRVVEAKLQAHSAEMAAEMKRQNEVLSQSLNNGLATLKTDLEAVRAAGETRLPGPLSKQIKLLTDRLDRLEGARPNG